MPNYPVGVKVAADLAASKASKRFPCAEAHGKYIYEIGYHVLPYFLKQWQKFKHIPLGVLAHSTHVRGDGRYENGIEYPRTNVSLATRLSPEDCAQLALGYVNPEQITAAEWQNREEEGILYVPKAGEMLYRVKDVGVTV